MSTRKARSKKYAYIPVNIVMKRLVCRTEISHGIFDDTHYIIFEVYLNRKRGCPDKDETLNVYGYCSFRNMTCPFEDGTLRRDDRYISQFSDHDCPYSWFYRRETIRSGRDVFKLKGKVVEAMKNMEANMKK